MLRIHWILTNKRTSIWHCIPIIVAALPYIPIPIPGWPFVDRIKVGTITRYSEIIRRPRHQNIFVHDTSCTLSKNLQHNSQLPTESTTTTTSGLLQNPASNTQGRADLQCHYHSFCGCNYRTGWISGTNTWFPLATYHRPLYYQSYPKLSLLKY